MEGRSLGTASIILNADGSLLIKGLTESEEKVETWGERLKKKMKNLAKSLGSRLGQGVTMGVGFALGKLGLESIGGAFEGTIEKLAELKDIGEYAQGLGTTGEEMSKLSGLARYAGTDIKQVIEGLATLNKMISEAGKGGEADKLFQNMGVDASEFKGMNAYQQFFKLFEVLSRSDDPMGRFQMLMAATGEDVGKLMVKLNRLSGTELEALAQKYRYTNREIAEATLASERYADAQLQIDQAARRIAISLAPLVETFSVSVTEALSVNGNAWSQWAQEVLPHLRTVALTLAGIVDIARSIPDALDASFNFWKLAGTTVVLGAGKTLAHKGIEGAGRRWAEDAAIGMDKPADRLRDYWRVYDKTNALFAMRAGEIEQTQKRLGESKLAKGLDALIEKEKALKEKEIHAHEHAQKIAKEKEVRYSPLEASVYGSAQWQRSYANQQFNQQQTLIQLQKAANQILQNINQGINKSTGFKFGVV